MALETAVTINQLDPANPSGPDRLAQGDDHLRLIKQVLKNTFPNITGPVTATQASLNALAALMVPVGVISLWYGASTAIPAGYALCDGSTVPLTAGGGTITTPDMRGKVPVGADATHATGSAFGQTSKTITTEVAGAHTHTGATTAGEGAHAHTVTVDPHALTVAEMPSHSHSFSSNPGSGGGSLAQSSGGSAAGTISTSSVGGGQAHSHTGSVAGSGAHNHTITNDPVAAHAHSATVDVTQPSIALHYIMRV